MGGMPPNSGPYSSNTNYNNQYNYESDDHLAMRRTKMPNHRSGPYQTEGNGGKNKVNNNNNISRDTNPTKPQTSQDDEGEEGEISESD